LRFWLLRREIIGLVDGKKRGVLVWAFAKEYPLVRYFEGDFGDDNGWDEINI
jgi:hypothetical protein